MKLLLLSNDLMIGARVEGTARQLGLTMVTVRDQQAATDAASAGDCRVLIVDLSLPGLNIGDLMESVKEYLPVVTCAPHVHEQRLTAARGAGCDVVLTRGQLDRELGAVLEKLLSA